MRPKLQEYSVLKLAGRIIPRSGGYNTSQLAAEYVSKACVGVHTRDFLSSETIIYLFDQHRAVVAKID